LVVKYIESAEFDELLVRIVRAEEQPNMQESLNERGAAPLGELAAARRGDALTCSGRR
jgi:hypothetical protein